MFTKVTCTTYLIWMIVIVTYIVLKLFKCARSKPLPIVSEEYVEFKEFKA